MQNENIIERAMMELVHHEPFFANLVFSMKRIYSDKIPTIGVNVTDTINLYINPVFWNDQSLAEQVDILKHECYHVLNNHFARFKDLEPQIYEPDLPIEQRAAAMKTASNLNVAADYAIMNTCLTFQKK